MYKPRIIHFFYILILTLAANFAFAWPENIRNTYKLEVLRNLGLTVTDYQYMSISVLMKNYGYSKEEAIKISKNLNEREAKKYLLEDFAIDYYEIPLEELKKISTFNTESNTTSELNKIYFESNGKTWVRWFQNPLHDSPFMEKQFPRFKKNGRFRALQTSSRSILIKDTEDDFIWSHKSSLKQAQGAFQKKEFSSKNADFQFQMSSVFKNDEFMKDKFFVESSYISLLSEKENFDEGQLTRSLEPFNSNHEFITLATLFEKDIALRVSKANGYEKKWEEFLKEKVMPSLGSIVGHMYENYGLIHNSLHSQNVVVEFNSQGYFVGVRLRDPDFNIDLEKFKKSVNPELFDHFMKSTNYHTNVLNKESLSIDFSVLNGLKRIDQLFTAPNRRKEFYRDLATTFLEGVLSRIAALRKIEISSNEIKERSFRRAFIQDDGGEFGSRMSFQLQVLDIDNLIDIHQSIPSYYKPKIRIQLDEAKIVIIESLYKKDISVNIFNENDTGAAWDFLVEEFIKYPEKSKLAFLINENDSVVIRRLIAMLNNNKSWKVQSFFMHLLNSYPKILEHDISFFFNSHYDPELMKLYLLKAPKNKVFGLWSFLDANRLLEYPQEILNRYIAKISLEKVDFIKSKIKENENQSFALRNSKLSIHKEALMHSFNLRNQIDIKLSNKCEKFFF